MIVAYTSKGGTDHAANPRLRLCSIGLFAPSDIFILSSLYQAIHHNDAIAVGIQRKIIVSQSKFVCKACGYIDNADINESKNIELLALAI